MIRVLLISDVRLYRDGLAAALGQRPNVQVVGAAAYRLEAVHRVRYLQPDVVLADLSSSTNLTVLRVIAESCPRVRVVGLAVWEVEEQIIECSKAGMHAYAPPDTTIEELIAITESVVRGESYCSPASAALARRIADSAAEHSPADDLTGRERDIVRLLERGLSNREIADALHIGLPTVKHHVHNILGKLHVRRRGEAVAQLRRLAVTSSSSASVLASSSR